MTASENSQSEANEQTYAPNSARLIPRVVCVAVSLWAVFFEPPYMTSNGLRRLIDSVKKVEWEMLRMFSLIAVAALLLATTAIFLLTQLH